MRKNNITNIADYDVIDETNAQDVLTRMIDSNKQADIGNLNVEEIYSTYNSSEYFENNRLNHNYYGFKPSITYILVNYATPITKDWLTDENSMEFYLNGKLTDRSFEMLVRNKISLAQLITLIQNVYINGFTAMVMSPDDNCPWIPDEVSIDWQHGTFRAARKKVVTEDMDNAEEMWVGSYYHNKNYYEFRMKEGEAPEIIERKRHIVDYAFYNFNSFTGYPEGIVEKLIPFEAEKYRAEEAIWTRLNRARPSIPIMLSSLKKAEDEIYEENDHFGELITIDDIPAGKSLEECIVFPPNQADEIPVFSDRIDKLIMDAMKTVNMTVMRLASEVQPSAPKVGEEIAYFSSTKVMREMVDQLQHMLKTIYENTGESILSEEIQDVNLFVEIVENPVDALSRTEKIKEQIPDMVGLLKDDPDMAKALGVTFKTVNQLIELTMRGDKIPNLLAPEENRLTEEQYYEAKRKEAEEAEQDAASLLAQAAVMEAENNKEKNQIQRERNAVDEKKSDNELEKARIQNETESDKIISENNKRKMDSLIKFIEAYDAELPQTVKNDLVKEISTRLMKFKEKSEIIF